MHVKRLQWTVGIILLLLIAKFFWPLFAYELPLGYDAGFYRYLFLKHAEALPPFWIAGMEPWAREHPPGLFIFSTFLLRAGIPVDWLIGWMWNLFPVALACVLAHVTVRRTTVPAGIGTLIAALLSIAYFDGFGAMYWKTFASLLWCVLAFDALERHKWLPAAIFGILCVATHNQTGLLFGLTYIAWELLPLLPFSFSSIRPHHGLRRKEMLRAAGVGGAIFIVGILLYMPNLQDAVLRHLPSLLSTEEVAAGNFPPASFYLRLQGILLLIAAYGFVTDVRQRRWTPWQLAVIVSLLFVLFRLIFYRRFFLQLDFFLLPFAGIGLADLWQRFRSPLERGVLVILLLVQAGLLIGAMARHYPIIGSYALHRIERIPAIVPADAYILGMENTSSVILRGWLPGYRVGGPGLFENDWSYTQWQTFITGTHEDRVALLQTLPRPAYLFITSFFMKYYAPYSKKFIADPCFEEIPDTLLYRVTCQSDT